MMIYESEKFIVTKLSAKNSSGIAVITDLAIKLKGTCLLQSIMLIIIGLYRVVL